MIALHDPDSDRVLVMILFEDEDEYRKGDEVLSAMSTDDTPGNRTSVTRYDVAIHRTMQTVDGRASRAEARPSLDYEAGIAGPAG